jgi:hypothetical protein
MFDNLLPPDLALWTALLLGGEIIEKRQKTRR